MSSIKPQKELSARLKYLKKAWRLTQKEMAARLGVALSSYQYYERGERDIPASLLILITTFGVDGKWLLTGKGEAFASALKTENLSQGKISVVEEHRNLVDKFEDKETAKTLNEKLIDLERISNRSYLKIVNQVNSLWEAVTDAIENYESNLGNPEGGMVGKERRNGTNGH